MFTKPTTIDNKVEALASQLQGQLIRPGDADYQEARNIWNGMIDKYPALIACCIDEQDVATAVAFARENDLLLSVRGGGHSVAGHATNDGGLVIDFSPMNSVEVDPEARTVRVGGGNFGIVTEFEFQAYPLGPEVQFTAVFHDWERMQEALQSYHLPQQFTSFVGRDKELAEIGQRLADPFCRLVTLVEPGGIDKTRLAIQATMDNAH